MQKTQMELIAAALRSLLPGKSWKLYFAPSSEPEFLEAFEVVTGLDADLNAIYSRNPADFGVTWAQIKAAMEQQA